MASHASTVVSLLLLLACLATSAAAFNITRLLGEFSNFSTFNDILSQTKLADEINRRQTITVLAVDNGAVSTISSLPSDVQRKVLSMHVILDYYDTAKLGAIKNKSAMLTTLFQSSGQATDRMGFLNYTKRADGVMVFGSAEPGAQVTSQMVKSIASRPYNISVLQVSAAIVPPGVGSADNRKARAPSPTPAKATTPGPAPAPSKGRKAAPPSKDEAPAPAPFDDTSADAPADAPGPANGPAADSPIADGPEAADAPAHEKSSDDAADAPEVSADGRVVASAGLGIVALLTMII
ncbi:fasciclin-like arabinogalactan protein 14 [Phragmites australis]|uniref:fasciclin-like arabinogalactan protein 14 n=1 Tax=Phragmites australis TaxID=29695 RepID=UPI002D767BA3|nr:fasciclin-like arabinogalactan protein 14 [Phragmites australis]